MIHGTRNDEGVNFQGTIMEIRLVSDPLALVPSKVKAQRAKGISQGRSHVLNILKATTREHKIICEHGVRVMCSSSKQTYPFFFHADFSLDIVLSIAVLKRAGDSGSPCRTLLL